MKMTPSPPHLHELLDPSSPVRRTAAIAAGKTLLRPGNPFFDTGLGQLFYKRLGPRDPPAPPSPPLC